MTYYLKNKGELDAFLAGLSFTPSFDVERDGEIIELNEMSYTAAMNTAQELFVEGLDALANGEEVEELANLVVCEDGEKKPLAVMPFWLYYQEIDDMAEHFNQRAFI